LKVGCVPILEWPGKRSNRKALPFAKQRMRNWSMTGFMGGKHTR